MNIVIIMEVNSDYALIIFSEPQQFDSAGINPLQSGPFDFLCGDIPHENAWVFASLARAA